MAAAKNNLQQRLPGVAHQNQEQIAKDLNQAARRLNQSNTPPTAAQQSAENNAKATAKAVQAATNNNNQLQSTTPDFNKAITSANRIHELAQKLLNENPSPEMRNDLQNAMNQADEARNAANEHNARQAQMALNKAGSLVSTAAMKNLADKTFSHPSAKLAPAAAESQKLATEQRVLAAKTTQQLQLLQRASQENNSTISNHGRQLAVEIKNANTLAKTVEHQTADGAPDLARAVAQARVQIKSAQQAQAKANQAGKAGNAAMAQEHQQSALLHMRLAQGALNGLLNSPEIRDIPQYNDAIAGEIHPQQATPPANKSGSKAGKPVGRNAPPPHANSLHDRLMAAAQQIKNALNSQQQAQTGNAGAAQQAAHALSAASQNLSGSQPGQPGRQGRQGELGQAGQPGQPGQTEQNNQVPGTGNSVPGMANQGLASRPVGSSGGNTANGVPPKTVTELGISPAEWRNLGPLRQKELLNTARQNIPAGYRRMVRDYYLRLAKMHRTVAD